jgi:hypothetical protein
MSDYTKWKERECLVTSLSLDPLNPRIPELATTPTQRDIVAELVTHDNVYELAKDIVEQGFFPTELLVGVGDSDGDTILEGNRRLAALKLLIAPELAPDQDVKKFRSLSEKVSKSTVSKVRVVFAPSREAAAPLIVNRHTRLGIHRWQPAQQAKYMRTLVRADMSIDEVAKQFGVSKAELIKNLKTDSMYQVACALDLPEPIAAVVRNPRQFNSSVLERLVQSPDAMSYLGVEFEEDGSISGKIDPNEFKKAFGRMVTDIATGQEDTRSLNKNSDIETYLKKFGSDAPNKKLKGSFTGDSLLGKASAPPPETKPTKNAKAAAKKQQTSLIPSGVKCHLDSPRINDIFRELRQLSVRQFPNATGALLRIFLELVVGNYLEKTKKIQPLLDKAKKDGKGNDWAPTARQMLHAVLADSDIILHPMVRKGLNKLVSDDDHPLSLDKMDQFVHNSYVAPTEDELRKLWHLLQNLIIPMLTEPAPPTTVAPKKAKAAK